MTEFRLAQISMLHYVRGLSQQEIASKLGYSKMTISRMLQRARESGVVETRVALPYELDEALSRRLCGAYGVGQALVIRSEPDASDVLECLGRVCAFELGVTIRDGTTLGVGIGHAIGALAEAVEPMRMQGVHVVQLMGGYTEVSGENPLNIVQVLCQKLGATGSYIALSAYLESAEARRVLFDNSALGREIRDRWGRCSEAVFGVGSVRSGSTASAGLPSDQRGVASPANAVGDVLGHFFDQDGAFVDSPLDDRLVGIPIETLLAIPVRSAVAGGAGSVPAIAGALRSGAVTRLITDVETANELCTLAGA